MAPGIIAPTTIIIFGASGDLTGRKLTPALYNNFKKGRLSECAHIIGFARRPYTDDEFRLPLQEGVKSFSGETYDPEVWEQLSGMLTYFQGNLDAPEDYARLEKFLPSLENGPVNRLYYLATASEYFSLSAQNLGKAGMAVQTAGWRRIVIEKPFGADLASARALNAAIHAFFDENQIYRIDHYLGKETAMNILFFRFANLIFEPIWNRRYIDNVQLTVAESVDVGHRAGYYNAAGVGRDMFQNHLLQLLTLVAMDAPNSFNADAVHREKTRVLESVRPLDLHDTVRAQYAGYREAQGVAPGSQTPTYAALKLYIDNARWKGVPFYMRSGKALAQKTSEIAIEFHRPPRLMFTLLDPSQFKPNILSLCIQPDEGIHLRIEAKLPDSSQEMRSVDMDFHYRTFFDVSLPDSYERLLLDALNGDTSLFTHSDAIEASWKLIDPIIQGWERDGAPALVTYPRESWGPAQADELLAHDGRHWRLGCQDDPAGMKN
jgi:glucose-6-phosphate 1-dehydrogenase